MEMIMTVESPAKEWENETEAWGTGAEQTPAKKKFSFPKVSFAKLPFGRKKDGDSWDREKPEKVKKEKPPKEKKVLTKEQKKKRRKTFIIWGVIVVLLAWLFLPGLFAGEQLPAVNVVQAAQGDVAQTITGSGTVKSEVETAYFSPVSATVNHCGLSVGDTVSKGDVLLTYDAAELDHLYQQADLTGDAGTYGYQDAITRDNENISEYNRSTHDIGILEQQVEDWDKTVEHLNDRVSEYSGKQAESAQTLAIKQGLLTEAEQKVVKAEADLKVAQTATSSGSSDKTVAQAKADLDAAKAEVSKIQSEINEEQDYLNEVSSKLGDYQNRLKDASKELGDFNSDLAEQKGIQSASDGARLTGAARSQLAANEDLNKLNASVTKEQVEKGRNGIVADYSGVVTSVTVVEGGPAAQGSALFTIASNEDVVVEMNVTRYDLEKLEEGQQAVITMAGKEYTGTVTKLSRLAEKNEKGTPVVKAEVKIENPDENVYLGLEANVSIKGKESTGVLTVPVEAVNTGQEGTFCYVVEDGVIVKKQVETGLSSDMTVEIVSGLSAGDQVVRSGAELLQEGMKVMAVEE